MKKVVLALAAFGLIGSFAATDAVAGDRHRAHRDHDRSHFRLHIGHRRFGRSRFYRPGYRFRRYHFRYPRCAHCHRHHHPSFHCRRFRHPYYRGYGRSGFGFSVPGFRLWIND